MQVCFFVINPDWYVLILRCGKEYWCYIKLSSRRGITAGGSKGKVQSCLELKKLSTGISTTRTSSNPIGLLLFLTDSYTRLGGSRLLCLGGSTYIIG